MPYLVILRAAQITAVLAWLWTACSSEVFAERSKYGATYAGVEFYGSSQLTRMELEKFIGIKPGAPLTQLDKAIERLNRNLALRHIYSNVQIVSATPDKVYVVIDVSDAATDTSLPTRRLKNPTHIVVRSEKPFLLLDQLEARLNKLSAEGRPWSERFEGGLRFYSDEPANLIVQEMLKQVPDMRQELLSIVAHDPDPNRRRRAIELLNWAGGVPDTSYLLMPAIDDADPGVRAAVAKYIYPRIEGLPDDFPFQDLVEAFSRMVQRPSHTDRSKALYCLIGLSKYHPELTDSIRVFNQERVKQLADQSVIATIKQPADELLGLFAKAPPPAPRQVTQEQMPGDTGSGF